VAGWGRVHGRGAGRRTGRGARHRRGLERSRTRHALSLFFHGELLQIRASRLCDARVPMRASCQSIRVAFRLKSDRGGERCDAEETGWGGACETEDVNARLLPPPEALGKGAPARFIARCAL
jgi:hypothetical protein